ncbi:hypothetical protein EC968_002440 [Mortierella alpina]|nr:hypothetical protein EC968_002440 [Mortierella alpina]
MDGRRAKNEGDGEDGGVVDGLGHFDGFVEAAFRAGDGGGVAAGVLETEPDALPKEKSEATTPGSFKGRGSSSDWGRSSGSTSLSSTTAGTGPSRGASGVVTEDEALAGASGGDSRLDGDEDDFLCRDLAKEDLAGAEDERTGASAGKAAWGHLERS